MTAALLLTAACRALVLPIGTQSLSVGEWHGTTSQGMPIAFTVTPDELLTTITLGYDFNGCTGSQTFASLSVRTAPDTICIPGSCPRRFGSYRAFGFTEGSVAGAPGTQVNGLFLPRGRAQGQAIFRDYPACGTAMAEWSATRP